MFKHITEWLERQQQLQQDREYREGRIYALTTIIVDQKELPEGILECDSAFAQGARYESYRLNDLRIYANGIIRVVKSIRGLT